MKTLRNNDSDLSRVARNTLNVGLKRICSSCRSANFNDDIFFVTGKAIIKRGTNVISKTYLYNFDPLNPFLYSKTGVYGGIY